VKCVVVLDGERHEVEVDRARSTVTVDGHEWPVSVVSSDDAGVSFELSGERVEVRRVDGAPTGPQRIVVNGEEHTLVVESSTGPSARPSVSAPPVVAVSGAGAAAADRGPGRAILPPMPGKVLEVRVHEGQRVAPGQVLVVVEAMKMRNEVTAPIAGAVTGLRVAAGANVSAHELLLRVVPG
jgi:biotin carboxyl carrier protein